ncbi:MAG: dihydropteroate synthase, partial [Patescibacteria group bacterium]
GEPKSMQENPTYTNVIEDIKNFFVERIQALKAAGVKDIILDPGIGFGKTLEHNLNILKHLEEFTTLGCPILVGPSRKSFIGKITGLPVEERLEGTLGAVAVSVMNGASIVRVHDVKACRRVLDIVDAIKTVK